MYIDDIDGIGEKENKLYKKMAEDMSLIIDKTHHEIHKKYDGMKCDMFHQAAYNAACANLFNVMAILFERQEDAGEKMESFMTAKAHMQSLVEEALRASEKNSQPPMEQNSRFN